MGFMRNFVKQRYKLDPILLQYDILYHIVILNVFVNMGDVDAASYVTIFNIYLR